ncbi:MAG: GTPase domain-containing protein [Gemmataceae bacterium]
METTWQTDPADLLVNIERWATELRERCLGDEPSLDRLRATLAESYGERLDAPADPLLVVMLCGPTAVGKSSLINAIAGAEISRQGLGATTSAAVLFVHERDDPSRLFEYGEAIGQLTRQPHTVVRHNRDLLLHKVLVDTPDIDSVLRQHRVLTAALVHAADLVLFVTSPEKYKTMQAAQWVSLQRRQRAMAFVLNKWDRQGIGLQYDRREVVAQDFRQILAEGGFKSPALFKVSSEYGQQLPETDKAIVRCEDELSTLKDWLEKGLDHSASAAIQDRRRRAAWGRVAAVAAAVVPSPIAAEPWVAAAIKALTDSQREARRLAQAKVVATAAEYPDRAVWPSTPGLFGIYARFLTWCLSARSGLRAFGGWRSLPKPESMSVSRSEREHPVVDSEEVVFGHSAVELLGNITGRLLLDVETRRLPLAPVRAGWKEAPNALATELIPMPARVEEDLLAEAMKPSVRRVTGLAALHIVELLLGAVLVLSLWRVGKGFFLGEYANGLMLLSTIALIAALVFLGHMVANLCFPTLRDRFRTELARRTERAVESAWQHAEFVLRDHVESISRLAQQGHELLHTLDKIIQCLGRSADGEHEMGRLFGDEESLSPTNSHPLESRRNAPECRHVPKFE